ncbi:hypothetical protein F4778DRAFT_776386 [Xylariomycetidae sp. FL2044]|nr:hypothetical protein F4778DRAFT_776386 [Xylariomycetidae sp. FL2044]
MGAQVSPHLRIVVPDPISTPISRARAQRRPSRSPARSSKSSGVGLSRTGTAETPSAAPSTSCSTRPIYHGGEGRRSAGAPSSQHQVVVDVDPGPCLRRTARPPPPPPTPDDEREMARILDGYASAAAATATADAPIHLFRAGARAALTRTPPRSSARRGTRPGLGAFPSTTCLAASLAWPGNLRLVLPPLSPIAATSPRYLEVLAAAGRWRELYATLERSTATLDPGLGPPRRAPARAVVTPEPRFSSSST